MRTALNLLPFALMTLSAAPHRPTLLPKFPSGWRLAQEPKHSECDRSTSDLLTAEADLDGDDQADTAMLLAKKRGGELGVWVWLTSSKSLVLVALLEVQDGQHDMGLAKVPPGTYETACAKGYWRCEPNEPRKLSLQNWALAIFTCASANRFAYWDAATFDFKTVWISD